MRTCPVCEQNNSDGSILSASRDHWILRQCANCSHVYLENTVNYEALQSEFRWSDSLVTERARRRAESPLFDQFSTRWKSFRRRNLQYNKCLQLAERYFPTGRVLDVGCGRGQLLSALSDRFSLYGIEIDSVLAEQARKRIGEGRVQISVADASSALSQIPDRFFSGVLMKCYLEHETSPFEVLREVARTLSADGKLIIKVPNYGCWNRQIRGSKWCGYRFPDHVNYFEPKTLKQLLNRAGLHVFRSRFVDHLPCNDNLYMIATPDPKGSFTNVESTPSRKVA